MDSKEIKAKIYELLDGADVESLTVGNCFYGDSIDGISDLVLREPPKRRGRRVTFYIPDKKLPVLADDLTAEELLARYNRKIIEQNDAEMYYDED